jgi:sulfate adenylyltransferase subunit 1
MVTGVSECNAVVILVDARHGVIEQTYRHYFISSLLRIPFVVFCINKMDLVNFDQQVFNKISLDIKALITRFQDYGQKNRIIPVSALKGDNIVESSSKMSWYKGDALLPALESFSLPENQKDFRFYVQTVIRPRTEQYHDYRGFAGRVSSGKIAVGDEVMVLPSRQTSKVIEINKANGNLQEAVAGQSVSIQLEHDIDLSRGGIMVKPNEAPQATKQINADVCWMNNQPLIAGKLYFIQTQSKVGKVKAEQIHFKYNLQDPNEKFETQEIAINDIGNASFKLADEWFLDAYASNPKNGSFIIIDPNSNNTVGIGIVK